jgi:hypothetical protein
MTSSLGGEDWTALYVVVLPLYPLDTRLGAPRAGQDTVKKKSSSGIETLLLGRPDCNVANIATEPSQIFGGILLDRYEFRKLCDLLARTLLQNRHQILGTM